MNRRLLEGRSDEKLPLEITERLTVGTISGDMAHPGVMPTVDLPYLMYPVVCGHAARGDGEFRPLRPACHRPRSGTAIVAAMTEERSGNQVDSHNERACRLGIWWAFLRPPSGIAIFRT